MKNIVIMVLSVTIAFQWIISMLPFGNLLQYLTPYFVLGFYPIIKIKGIAFICCFQILVSTITLFETIFNLENFYYGAFYLVNKNLPINYSIFVIMVIIMNCLNYPLVYFLEYFTVKKLKIWDRIGYI